MTLDFERRALQLMVGVLTLIPLYVGLRSLFGGPAWIGGVTAVPVDLDSHFRYLSGLFVGLGIGFASCVPHIEWRGGRFRLLGGIVIAGGIGRLLSYFAVGEPSHGQMIGLAIELVVVPLLLLWQAALHSRWRRLRMPIV
ncbi:DUF4345 domain-containing protein [Stakelama saccharophila]|uniref:DUF4345 domain-containing protein n=1 Tax=Stakelama saccharophila TaxID=3075605 RepID=A0ABZ0BCL4_9SPHN|nr:DUF4345 domain-containing protein [Stakelama sp. W311]WNO54416.1 DUF4345 domain-containing protein [Stakelama sp. W311]